MRGGTQRAVLPGLLRRVQCQGSQQAPPADTSPLLLRPPSLPQTLDHLIRKAGFAGAPVLVRSSTTLRVTRYVSTTCSLTYDEYRALKDAEAAGAAPADRAATLQLRKRQQEVVAAAQ